MVAQVSDWFTRLSEPVRAESRLPAFSYYFARPAYFGGPDPHFIDWFTWLTEPVREKPPLTAARMPYYFVGINYVEFRFSLTELGDSITVSLAVHVPKNLARVAITELQSYTAQVTLEEIKYTRGYS